MGVYLKGVNKEWADRVLTVAGYRQFFKDDEIVEVKEPHGRLIDADKYFNKVLDEANGINDKELADNFIELSHWLLEKAPTVIEAEEEE